MKSQNHKQMDDECIFTNDNNVKIKLIEHNFTSQFAKRDAHEVGFRQISTFFINKGLVKNIIDLGAWIGDNSIPWAKNISGTVYAIDPSPANQAFIRSMCEKNHIHNLKQIQKAISYKNEFVSTNDSIDHCSFGSDTTGRTVLEAVSLDYLLAQKEIETVDYIHLDVEGMEYKVLVGSDHLIDKCRPIIAYEQHLEVDKFEIIGTFLGGKKAYKIFLIDEILPGCRHDCRNFLAIPIEKYSFELIREITHCVGKPLLVEML